MSDRPWTGTRPDAYLFGCPKIPFENYDAAESALSRMREDGTDDGMNSYLCENCGKHHHGHPGYPPPVELSCNGELETGAWQLDARVKATANYSVTMLSATSSSAMQYSQNTTSASRESETLPEWKRMWLERPGGPLGR